MGIKETIAEKMRTAGYDFLTAYEWADRIIKEFLDSGEKERVYYVHAGSRLINPFKLVRNTL